MEARLVDEATFDGEVTSMRDRYAARDTLTLPKYVADAYDEIDDEADRRAALERFVAWSETKKEYWDAVHLLARRQLRRGNPLPTALAHWIRDVLADQGVKRQKDKARPRPGKGRREAERDRMIRSAIDNLVARGYTEMRSGRKGNLPEACAEGGSACDIAGAAFGLGYKNTERVWLSGKASRAS